MGGLSYIQLLTLREYQDCKRRTRKQIEFRNEKADEELVRFMLENSSQTDHDTERAFDKTSSAIHLICLKMCPGEWCSRGHCQFCRSGYAYRCSKGLRPAICKDFKKWREGQAKRKKDEEIPV